METQRGILSKEAAERLDVPDLGGEMVEFIPYTEPNAPPGAKRVEINGHYLGGAVSFGENGIIPIEEDPSA